MIVPPVARSCPSRLEIFDGAGHFPHVDDSHRFAGLMADFLATTAPARADLRSLRHELQRSSTTEATSARTG